jgi:hypothetical protein
VTSTGHLVGVVKYKFVCPKYAAYLAPVRGNRNASRTLIDGLMEKIICWKAENKSADNIKLDHTETFYRNIIWI